MKKSGAKEIITHRQGPVVTRKPEVARAASLLGIPVIFPATQEKKTKKKDGKKTS